jgi:hypothetical protein
MKENKQLKYHAKTYDSNFYKDYSGGSYQSACIVMQIVKDILAPRSLIDFGCGSGSWLRAANDCGILECCGIEGEWAKSQHSNLPFADFLYLDLEQLLGSGKTYPIGRKYDLAVSLEVAEHISEKCACLFVDLLIGSSDMVLFAAAVPSQGGRNHINEKWQSYWAKIFNDRGFSSYDVIRPKIWTDNRVQVWYRQNSILYVRNGCELSSFGAAKDAEELDVIHPKVFLDHISNVPMRQAYRTVFDVRRYTRRLASFLHVGWPHST